MNKLFTIISIILSWFLVTACADIHYGPAKAIDLDSVIIKAVSHVQLSAGGVERGPLESDMHMRAIVNPQSIVNVNVNVSVVDNVSATMTLSPWTNPGAQTPTSATTLIPFGNISVATLFDNDLNHCPANPSNHCNTAGFSAFMQTQAGLLNTVDATEVMPIQMSGPLTALTALGIASPGLFLQSIAVPASKHTVKLSDFAAPSFPVDGDFSSVGSGTYTGIITIVYFIAN